MKPESDGTLPPEVRNRGRCLIRLQEFSDKVDKGICLAFRRWALCVSKYPYRVIVSSTIFAVLCAAAFFLLLRREYDSKDLFTPQDSQSFEDKDYVESLYGIQPRRGRIVTIKNNRENSDEDICTRRSLLADEDSARRNIQEYFRFYQALVQLEVESEGKLFIWNDICVRASHNDTCRLTSVLDLWNYDADIIEAEDFNPLDKINSGNLTTQFGQPFNTDFYLGKSKEAECQTDSDLVSANVEAFGLTFNYQYQTEEVEGIEKDPESYAWLEKANEWTREYSENSSLDAYLADEQALDQVSEDQMREDIQILTIGYFLIFVYTNIVLFKNNRIACKSHLSFISVIGIAMAVLTAFGLAQIFQIKFNGMCRVLPYLILGLGLDDTFVILGQYHRTEGTLSVTGRLAETLERAGSSIFVTTFTDFFAFLLGVFTRLPGIRDFSAYAAIAVFFDFVYQITFFVAFLVLEARREERLRTRPSYNQGNPPEIGNQDLGGHAPQPMSPPLPLEVSIPNNVQSTASPTNSPVLKKIFGKGAYNPETPNFSTKLAGTYLPAFTLHPMGKIVVLLVECTVLGLAIYGCTKVRMNFNYVKMFGIDGTAVKTGFDLEEDYFYGNQVFFSVYTKETEQDYFYHQQELITLQQALEDDEYVVTPVYTWYQSFLTWLREDSSYTTDLVRGLPPDPERFNKWLKEYLNTTSGLVYQSNVIFGNGTNERVVSSRIEAFTVKITGGEQSVALLDSIRESVQTGAPSLDPVPYSLAFLFFDGFRVIKWETIRNVLLAGVGVFIVNLVVLASLPTALIVVSMIALTDVVVFGYMWYVDQYFNPVTAINLVLAVGIAVDYSAHIAHSFLVVDGDRTARAKLALKHIGGEVLSGALTTWLGIAFMGFAEHYFFRSFFRMFFAIIVAGAWHGLVLLPVVLSLVGSPPYPSRLLDNEP